MASSKAPPIVPCRICGTGKALFAITKKEKRLIVYIAVCGKCHKENK